MTQLYHQFFDEPPSPLFKLHPKLDKQVRQTYRFEPTDNIVEKLFHFKGEVAEKETRGEFVLSPQAL